MRYQIIQKTAGQGGFGTVDRAKDTELERDVAIKTLDPLFKSGASPEDIERFKREAKTLASLSHPNIPAIYDVEFSKEDNVFRIIFEWIDGITARKYLSTKGIMSLEQVRRWFPKVCSALEHAHNKGVIHRDVKPSNIIITQDERSCYLVDFGIALRSSDLERMTGDTPIGTPGYMSQEQEQKEDLDGKTDIWSLAIVLYECLAGHRPVVGEYNPLTDFSEGIPPAIDDLIRSCLTEKDTRLSSANDFANRLVTALRPTSSLARILSSGRLYQLQSALTLMGSDDYADLPAGQRILIMSRVKDMVRVDEFKIRNAFASILAELVRIGFRSSENDYFFIVENGLKYGFSIKYGDKWIGNPQIREALRNVGIECHQPAHNVLCEKVLEFLEQDQDIEKKERWFYHDMRISLQNLLANGCCVDEKAEHLGKWLNQINEISHKDQEM